MVSENEKDKLPVPFTLREICVSSGAVVSTVKEDTRAASDTRAQFPKHVADRSGAAESSTMSFPCISSTKDEVNDR
jgi:hypothetical protein